MYWKTVLRNVSLANELLVAGSVVVDFYVQSDSPAYANHTKAQSFSLGSSWAQLTFLSVVFQYMSGPSLCARLSFGSTYRYPLGVLHTGAALAAMTPLWPRRPPPSWERSRRLIW